MTTTEAPPRTGDDGFSEALARYAQAMDRLYNGDPELIKLLYLHGDETSQCGYWGGAERGRAEVSARWDWVAAQMVPGDNAHTQEVLHTSVTAEMAYAVFVERVQTRLVDQPAPQQIDIRVTAVFRREADGWKAVHRHRDSLVAKNRWARRRRYRPLSDGAGAQRVLRQPHDVSKTAEPVEKLPTMLDLGVFDADKRRFGRET